MPMFRYQARDAAGRPLTEVCAAASAGALSGALRERGLLVVDIEPAADAALRRSFSLNPVAWLPPASLDVEVGLQQLATMLQSGLSLLEGLGTLAEQARRPRMARVWEDVRERIEAGGNLSQALASHEQTFSAYIVHLVRVGEHSGTLAAVLARGAEHLERRRTLRMTVLNALTYPAIVLIMAVGVSLFMVLNVIPKVERFLAGRGQVLPPLTQAVLDISTWLRAYLLHVGIGVAAALVAMALVWRWLPGRRAMHAGALRLPLIGGVVRLSGTAGFARGMGVLLESGVTLLDSLRTVEPLVGNLVISGRIEAARLAVMRGETLARTLKGGCEFLPMLSRMVAVGESTGTLSSVLSEVARFHEGQLAATVRRLSVLIEPVMIAVVGGIVGFVYIAFFVALFSLATGRH